MIVPMKKLSLLLYHREKESFLNSLQDLGVVHVVENSQMRSDDLDSLQNKTKTAGQVIKTLKQIGKAKKISVPQNKKGNAEEVINSFRELETRHEGLEQQIGGKKKELALIEPWGEFQPATVSRLKESGITIRFFVMNEKKFIALKKDDITLEVINRQSGSVYFIVLEREEHGSIDAEEITLPQVSLKETQRRIEDLQNQKRACEQSMEKMVADQDILKFYLSNQTDHLSLEAARLSMEEAAEGKVLSLTGWLPVKKEKKVAAFLDGFCAWYAFALPQPDDSVPVKMQNGPFSQLFEPITKIFALPDYFELDPTPFFAPLFAFFFGLCLGDVGYGLIIMALSIFAYTKVNQSLKGITVLGMVLGFMTLVAGVFVNTFFGHPIFAFADSASGLFKSGGSLALLRQVETESGAYFPAMPFAMYLGVIQMILGLSMKAYNNWKNKSAVHSLHPIANIIMMCGILIFIVKINFIDLGIFVMGAIPVGPWISAIPDTAAMGLCGSGFLLLLLFNNPDKGIGIRLGLGIWEFYQFATGLMSDVLSYLRLFALGLASGLLGMAFNQIAFMVVTRDGVVHLASPLIVITLLILVVGHTLNLGLNALGSFVHPLRLTFVEFYKNLEFKGGSKPYKPFTKMETI